MNLSQYQEFVSDTRAKKDLFTSQVDEKKTRLLELREKFSNLQTAQEVMNKVSVLAQTEFKEAVESLVTEGLQHVFGENYSFEIESTINRNQAEAQFWVVIDGVRHSLKEELGGGVVDIVSFTLKVVFWALQITPSDPVLLFDEPLKNLDSERLEAVGRMIKLLSERMGVQYIIITHEQELAAIADTSYRVVLVNGTSVVERIK